MWRSACAHRLSHVHVIGLAISILLMHGPSPSLVSLKSYSDKYGNRFFDISAGVPNSPNLVQHNFPDSGPITDYGNILRTIIRYEPSFDSRELQLHDCDRSLFNAGGFLIEPK